jgi:anti-sigma B factor antagonist
VRPIDLLFESRTEGDWTVLEVKGEVDIYTAPKLRERMIELIEAGSTRIVVDLEGVEFMDSTGLGSLVSGLKRVREADGQMSLVCTRDPVLKILTITGLDKVFPIRASVEEATAG